jgi:hypothetical protein
LLERGKNEIVQTEIEGDVVCWCYRAWETPHKWNCADRYWKRWSLLVLWSMRDTKQMKLCRQRLKEMQSVGAVEHERHHTNETVQTDIERDVACWCRRAWETQRKWNCADRDRKRCSLLVQESMRYTTQMKLCRQR